MSQVEISNLNNIKESIKKEITIIGDSFIKLGYYFKQVRDKELYKIDGYKDVFEFGQKEFSQSGRTVYRYMQINDEFSIDGNSMEIIPQYSGYGVGKLTAMLGMEDEQKKIVPINATVKLVEEYKKNIDETEKEKQFVDVDKTIENTKGEGRFPHEKNNLYNFVDNYFKTDGKLIFEKVISTILSEAPDKEEKIMYAFAPSKFKTFRIKGSTVIFKEEGIYIMMMGKLQEKHTYAELLQTLEEVFHPAAEQTAEDIYKNQYGEPLKEPVKELQKAPEPKKEAKQEKQQEKKPEPVKTTVKIEDVDEQIPGQIDIKDIPEAQPDPIKTEETEDEESLEDPKEETEKNEENDNPLSCRFDSEARCLVASKESCDRDSIGTCMYYKANGLEKEIEEENNCIIRDQINETGEEQLKCSGGISEDCNNCDKSEQKHENAKEHKPCNSIDDLNLSVSSYNCLKKAGIDTIDNLTNRTLEEMKCIRNLGLRSLEEVLEKLKGLGLHLKDSVIKTEETVIGSQESVIQKKEEQHIEAEVIQTADKESDTAAEETEIQKAIEYFRQQNEREKNLLGDKVHTDPTYKYRTLAIRALERLEN